MLTISACAHKHQASDKWSSDENKHWHGCTDDSCDAMFDQGLHSFDDGKVTTPATEEAEGVKTYTCKTCGYGKTETIEKLLHIHTYSDKWSSDDNYHWHASTCGHEDKDKEAHDFDDGWVQKPATETEEFYNKTNKNNIKWRNYED